MRKLGVAFALMVCLAAPAQAYGKAGERLTCNHIDEGTFYYALDTARDYALDGSVTAGVVPHHLTAAPLIGGFFAALAENGEAYDTVVLVGPNHTNGAGDVVVSTTDWDIFDGAECDKDLIGEIQSIALKNGRVAANDARMAGDHALSTLIPFVEYYWPDAKVAPVLLGSSLDYNDTLTFSDALNTIISVSDKRVLLLCSIDFSHYLQPEEAERRDAETVKAIEQAEAGQPPRGLPAYQTVFARASGLRQIHAFTDAHVDSSAALITYLNFSNFTGGEVRLLERADASDFVEVDAGGVTSYLVMVTENKS